VARSHIAVERRRLGGPGFPLPQVYEKVGLGVLRRAWINLDAIWAGALTAAGFTTLVS
jgi:hypothetical protein